MRKLISASIVMAMLLALLLPACGALAEGGETTAIAFPGLPFTTLADFDCVAQVEGNNELFVYTGTVEAMPYLHINLQEGADRVADAQAYIDDAIIPDYREAYKPNGGIQFAQHGDFQLAGRYMANVEMEFKNKSGRSVHGLVAVEALEGYSVIYSMFYNTDPSQDAFMLAALNTLAANLKYTGGSSAAPAPQSQGGDGRAASLKDFSVSRAERVVPATTQYSCYEFTATLPANWSIVTGGLLGNFGFRCYDPADSRRCLFVYSELGPWLKSQAAKDWWISHPNPYNLQQPIINNSPVLEIPSIKCIVERWEALRDSLEIIYPMHLAAETFSPDVLADINRAQVLETVKGPTLEAYRKALASVMPLNGFPDASINRFTFVASDGAPGEGLMGGITIDTVNPFPTGTPGNLDLWFYYGNCVVGCTAPMGELQELAPTLIQCATSFRFTDDYLKLGARQGKAMADLTAVGDSYVSSWEDRERSYDIMSQKYSDATLGYDRLYDRETGEVYRADLDFYDSYDLHRYEYSNPNLVKIDDSTQQYYLQGVDYYITR